MKRAKPYFLCLEVSKNERGDMYGRGSISDALTGSVVTGSGIVALPHTSGNALGGMLAYAAITIGILLILSQVILYVLRKKYQK